MKRRYFLYIYLLSVLFLSSCTPPQNNNGVDARYLHQWNEALQAGVMNDFFSPPVAGRMNAYPNLMAYLVIHQGEKNSLATKIKDLPIIPSVDAENKDLIALYAFYYVGKKMIYSYQILDDYLLQFDSTLIQDGYTASQLEQAKTEAGKVSSIMLDWVQKDNYKQSRSDTKYSLKNTPGSWKPTAPDYLDALEPNWETIRPFYLDSASQFTMKYAPYPYSMDDKNSNFYRELMEVMDQVDKTDSPELNIAKFWDCNPIEPRHVSHVTYADKKLTPGGHWLSIGRTVSRAKQDNIAKASTMYALLSTSIHDGFIACWDGKYYYNYIRPSTAIQDHINSNWRTLILTPNFPEYPSGHSVISGVASTILASLYGGNTVYQDKSEEPFGMRARSFPSFDSACNEAAMSRFYAGIHFKKAIVDGKALGKDVAQLILNKVN